MSINCGHCSRTHDTVADVKACSVGNRVAASDRLFSNEPTPRQIDYLCSLAEQTSAEPSRDYRAYAATLDRSQVSAEITVLKALADAMPRKPRASQVIITSDVPAGYYAVESATGNNDLDFYRVSRPAEGTYAGRIFVDRVIGGHPDTHVRAAEAQAALDRIAAAGPGAAAFAYGQAIGRCSDCNRHLTDAESRARSKGPDCAAKNGFYVYA